ncbi:hypothetical protein [Limnohabitans sp.]|uniref:hypothetical protein n=1 Tax=Limnohabitans sp. TaxID=1907725 RepID=UPI0039BD3FB2|nr:hypothetical protein [Comamonadaceae bacterium]
MSWIGAGSMRRARESAEINTKPNQKANYPFGVQGDGVLFRLGNSVAKSGIQDFGRIEESNE